MAALVAGSIFAILTVVTGGGFPRHVILYNVNRFALQDAVFNLIDSGVPSTYVIDLGLAVATAVTLLVRKGTGLLSKERAGQAMMILYFGLSTAGLAALGKTGSNINYMIPWCAAWALLIGVGVAEVWNWAEQRGSAWLVAGLFAALALQSLLAPPFGDRRVVDLQFHRQYEQLIALARTASKPVYS